MAGAGLRLGRLFRRESRRSFTVAFDRTLPEGPAPFRTDAQHPCCRGFACRKGMFDKVAVCDSTAS